jgi:hypothetical protein
MRIISGWHQPIWRVVLGPYGLVYSRRIRRSTAVPSPLTLAFFRQTLEPNYGLHYPEQKLSDTWNSLWQGAAQDIVEYNVDLQHALTDLAGLIID